MPSYVALSLSGRRCSDWAGILGMDDVGMHELADRLDLAVKAADHVRIAEEVRADHFDSGHAIHLLVVSLEDLAGAAGAEPFHQNVWAHEQLAALVLKQLIDLV